MTIRDAADPTIPDTPEEPDFNAMEQGLDALQKKLEKLRSELEEIKKHLPKKEDSPEDPESKLYFLGFPLGWAI